MTETFYPRQQQRLRAYFRSTALKRRVTVNDVPQLDDDEVDVLYDELTAELCDLRSDISAAMADRAEGGRGLPPAEWSRMQSRKAFLGAMHQKLQLRRKAARERMRTVTQEELQPSNGDGSDALLSGHSTAWHFQQIARSEASAADYQRWVLQAESRRGRELFQLLKDK